MNGNGKIPKTTSPKQIAANRNNARKSTGPKTADGKAVSKMNAVKHGILSNEVIVRGLHIKEHPREFKALREEFWNSLAPVGPVEEMLVERIVTTYWRLRRALTAETGEIALSVDNGHWRRTRPESRYILRSYVELGELVSKMQESAVGLRVLTMILEKVRDDVKQDGELTEAALGEALKSLGGKANVITDELTKLRGMLANNPEGLAPEALKAKHQQAVLDYIESELGMYKWRKESCEEREEMEEEARQAADVLPPPSVLDKIMRYETTLERYLYRAMNQLERLQRRRNGEVVPPPISMEVTH